MFNFKTNSKGARVIVVLLKYFTDHHSPLFFPHSSLILSSLVPGTGGTVATDDPCPDDHTCPFISRVDVVKACHTSSGMGTGSVAAGGLTNYACGGDGIGDDVTTLLYKRTYACPTNALFAGMFK